MADSVKQPGKIIINAGPSGSGKTTRSAAWKKGSPNRSVIDEANGLAIMNAIQRASDGTDVMLNILVPEGMIFETTDKAPELVTGFQLDVEAAMDEVKQMLLAKNQAYGNAAMDPIRVFSKANSTEQLKVRIDDKLSRLARGNEFADEDTILDLMGYLVLLRIASGAASVESA